MNTAQYGSGVVETASYRRRGVVIAGMHRSGTSALTRVLSLIGGDLPRRVMQPDRGNQDGFWEPQAVVAVHEALLAQLGGHRLDWKPIPEAWFATPSAERAVRRLRAVVAEDYGAARLLLIKDPRICGLLPLWVRALRADGIAPSFVLPVRNPIEVAASLAARDGTPFIQSTMLWLSSFLAAERGSRGFARCLVHYDEVLNDWREAAGRIASALDLPLAVDNPAAARQVMEFLKPTSRHHHTDPASVERHADIHPSVRRLYRFLLSGRPLDDGAPLFDALWAQLAEAQRFYGTFIAEAEMAVASVRAKVRRAAGYWPSMHGESEPVR